MTGKPGAALRTGTKPAGKALAQGGTATLLLTSASAVEQVRNDLKNGWRPWKDLSPEAQEKRKEEWCVDNKDYNKWVKEFTKKYTTKENYALEA